MNLQRTKVSRHSLCDAIGVREILPVAELMYHVDGSIDGNKNENHPFVKLLEADGRAHLHEGVNRGDAGVDAFVTLTNMVASGAGIKARIGVRCPAGTGSAHLRSRRASARKSSRAAAGRKRTAKARPKTSPQPRG